MEAKWIFWPVLAQMLLNLYLYIPLVRNKYKAYADRSVDRKRSPFDPTAWPEAVMKIDNNLRNQFETPLLFILLAFFFYLTQTVTVLVLILSWLFVACRLAHMFIHTGSNYVPWRMKIFAASLVILLLLIVLAGLALL